MSKCACSVGFASCLVSRLGCHIVWQLSAADFKHPCLKPLGVHFIRHPCLTRTVRVRPPAPKIIPRSTSGRKCGGACRNAVVWVAASLQRLCATACKHPCLKPLGVHFIRHPCLCGRWGRCIVQRLWATAIVHPCTTRKLRVLPPAAPKIIPRSLSWRKFGGGCRIVLALLVSHPCLVSRLGCHIVWQLSAADFKHPCLKLGASTIVHPCTTRTVRVRPPAPKKAGLCCLR